MVLPMRYYDLARGRKPGRTGGETKIRLSTNIIISYEKCAPEGVRSTPAEGAFFNERRVAAICLINVSYIWISVFRHSAEAMIPPPITQPSSSYHTDDCPGAAARTGASNVILTVPGPVTQMSASCPSWW